MIFCILNLICCMQHNTLRRKPLHVFNTTFWTELLAISTIFFFFSNGIILSASILFLFAAASRLILHYSINEGRPIYLIYRLIYSTKMYLKKLFYHFSTLMQLCVKTIKNDDTFQGIRSRRDCAAACQYKTILYMCSALIIYFTQ